MRSSGTSGSTHGDSPEAPASGDGPRPVTLRDEPPDWGRVRQEARLLRRVTEAANEASATSDLFDRVVVDITDAMDWSDGRVLTAQGRDADDQAAGMAWRTGLPASTRRQETGPADGDTVPSGVVAVPVAGDGRVAAVLEFSTPDVVVLDDLLASLLMNVGRQLGVVVDREQARAELEERTQELERSNGELERFAYVASHDLQEPLRKIVGFAELLEQRYEDAFDQDGREYLEYVVDGARRMQRLIKGLLAYSRAGRATPTPETVDLARLVEQVLDVLQLRIEEAAAEVAVGELPTVWGDAGQLSEVVTNLVGNAVKYGPAGGATITIEAQPARHGRMVEITVADDGIGIETRYAEQVFEVFRRLHGPAEYPGTGIGLAIARRFVEANGGRVWVLPNEPAGSVFHLTIPLPPEEAA